MKILTITLPRSRSNWATSTISEYYKVPNLYEPYRHLFAVPYCKADYQPVTDSLLSIVDCVFKIEITQLTDRHNKSKVIDLNLLALHSFDKIYTTSRNITDMVCSHRVANEFDRLIFSSDETAPPIKTMTFDHTDQKSIISLHRCLVDTAMLQYVQDWLTSNNIEYIPLDYDTIIDYSIQNWQGAVQTQWSATNYDYSTIFSNYKDIPEIIDEYRLSHKNLLTF